MTPASSRAGLLFVVQRGEFFLRRLVRVVATFLGKLCLAVLRAIITVIIVTTCVMVMLHFLGVPVSEFRDKFEALGRLARILS